MADTSNIRRCVCGKLFEVFEMYVGDQTRCGACKESIRRELVQKRVCKKAKPKGSRKQDKRTMNQPPQPPASAEKES